MCSLAGDKLVALVTGANQGIGKEIARGLASEGFKVLLGARREAAGEEAAKDLAAAGDVTFVSLDVVSPESVDKAAKLIEETYGRLDVLVCGLSPCISRFKRSSASVDPSSRAPFLILDSDHTSIISS